MSRPSSASGVPKTKRATGLYAEMDLTGVVSTLESHWVVLDAELSEIKKDFNTLRALTRKHGDFWSRPMAQLKKLRTQKENLLKECAGVHSPQPRSVVLLAPLRRPPPRAPTHAPLVSWCAGSNSRWSSSTSTSSRVVIYAQRRAPCCTLRSTARCASSPP